MEGPPDSSPPGSTSGSDDEEPVTKRLASPGKKRSHENMEADAYEPFTSSATMMGDVTWSSPQANAPEQSSGNGVKPSTAAHSSSMGPAPLPTSQLPSSQKAPTSAQHPSKPKPKSPPTAKPTSRQRQPSPSPEAEDEPETEDVDAVSEHPQERLPNFAWQDLHQRYHDKMTELDGREEEAMKDFSKLCEVDLLSPPYRTADSRLTCTQYFAIWADAGSKREVDRSFKR